VEYFGVTGPAEHRFDGKTDPQIVRELMTLEGWAAEHIDARMTPVLGRYVEVLHEELRDPEHVPTVYPGVHELLAALGEQVRARRVALGLLTGNVAPGARAKLSAAGIDPAQFVIGAFGSEHEERPQLPAIACRHAQAMLHIEFTGADVVVIGDTPADMTCGRGIGARAIGVATGQYDVSELCAFGAYAAFQDFSRTADVVDSILRD
jgi:phosphoglycolate phosphatase-like HAD superfamily hydrolase